MITLPLGADAQAGTCGSCKFFQRLDDLRPVGQGCCNIKLPPAIATKYDLGREILNSRQFEMIEDTDRCDLQRPDGKQYIIQRRAGP